MNAPTGTTPESECSLRKRNARRFCASSDCSFAESDNLYLVGLQATGDVWDSNQDVKVPRSRGLFPAAKGRRACLSLPRGETRRAAFSALLSSLLVGLAISACGGGGPSGSRPVAPLSSSIAAQNDLRQLQASFAQSSRAERVALEPLLQAFEARYPNDALKPVADVMLAWIALDQGNLERARALSGSASRATGGRGTTADLATLIDGAADLRQGKS